MMFSKKYAFLMVFCLIAGGLYYSKTVEFNKVPHEEKEEDLEEQEVHNHEKHSHKSDIADQDSPKNTDNPKVKLDPSQGAHGSHGDDPHVMGKTVDLPPIDQREAFKPINEQERSLETMTNEVLRLVQEKRSHTEFFEFLKKSELAPRMANSQNEDTGGMIMIRSDKSLPGTRYYHAQFFEGEEGEQPFAQHVSFESPPGPNSFERAQQAAEVLAEAGSKTYSVKGNFVQYKLKDCNVLWVKKLDANDLENDPFNAYTADDVGSVRTAIEQDIHCND